MQGPVRIAAERAQPLDTHANVPSAACRDASYTTCTAPKPAENAELRVSPGIPVAARSAVKPTYATLAMDTPTEQPATAPTATIPDAVGANSSEQGAMEATHTPPGHEAPPVASPAEPSGPPAPSLAPTGEQETTASMAVPTEVSALTVDGGLKQTRSAAPSAAMRGGRKLRLAKDTAPRRGGPKSSSPTKAPLAPALPATLGLAELSDVNQQQQNLTLRKQVQRYKEDYMNLELETRVRMQGH